METSRETTGLSIITEPGKPGEKAALDFHLRIKEEDGVTVLCLRGVLNIYSSHELKDILFKLADNREVKVILDLSQLYSIDSAGIGTIIAMMHRTRRIPGARMIICGISGHVEKVFVATRIISLFHVVSGVDEAITILRN